jgi:hypothetical protein
MERNKKNWVKHEPYIPDIYAHLDAMAGCLPPDPEREERARERRELLELLFHIVLMIITLALCVAAPVFGLLD